MRSEKWKVRVVLLTISSEVVIEDLEEREGVPGVLWLFREDLVHVHGKK